MMILVIIAICLAVLAIGGCFHDIASDIKRNEEKRTKRRGGNLMRIDYGCREDFSQRYEEDPWSMFRG